MQIFPFTIITNSKQPHRDRLFLEECEEIFEPIYCSAIPDMEQAEHFFQKWKKYPEVWNWHYNALIKNGLQEEADKLLKRSIELFPDYLPGKLAYARSLIQQDRLMEASAYLGSKPHLQRWYPKRYMYTNSEVVDYYSTFIELELAKGTFPRAEEHVQMLEVLEDTQTLVSKYKLQIASLKLGTINDRIFAFPVKEPIYISPQPPTDYKLEPFKHPEIEQILQNTQIFVSDHLEILKAFPRESVIKDLEQALFRTMFANSIENNSNPSHYSIPHIIWFLYALEAVESAPIVKYLLQMNTEFFEHRFGDTFVEDSWFLFFLILQDNPQPLINVLYQPNLQSYPKTALIYAMEQLAFHNPDNRNRVISWLGDLLQFYITNCDNNNINDTSFTSYLEDAALHLKAIELLPLLKTIHKSGCIDEEHQGSYTMVEEEMKRVGFKIFKQNLPELDEIFVT